MHDISNALFNQELFAFGGIILASGIISSFSRIHWLFPWGMFGAGMTIMALAAFVLPS